MRKDFEERMEELDLKELFNIFWNRKIYMILIIIIFILLGIVYTLTMVTPKYRAKTQLILTKNETSTTTTQGADSITQADVTLNQKLLPTYKELVKTPSLLKQVINNLGIDMSASALQKNVSIKLVGDSEMLEINIINENPEYAALIANELAKVFPEMVAANFGINNISIIEPAEVPTSPDNVNHTKDIVIFAFVGIVVAVGYAIIANMLDTTIKSQEDIDKHTKLTVLAEIPLYESDMPIKKGGRK